MKLWVSLSTENTTEEDGDLGLPKDLNFQPEDKADEDDDESLEGSKSRKEVGF